MLSKLNSSLEGVNELKNSLEQYNFLNDDVWDSLNEEGEWEGEVTIPQKYEYDFPYFMKFALYDFVTNRVSPNYYPLFSTNFEIIPTYIPAGYTEGDDTEDESEITVTFKVGIYI